MKLDFPVFLSLPLLVGARLAPSKSGASAGLGGWVSHPPFLEHPGQAAAADLRSAHEPCRLAPAKLALPDIESILEVLFMSSIVRGNSTCSDE